MVDFILRMFGILLMLKTIGAYERLKNLNTIKHFLSNWIS